MSEETPERRWRAEPIEGPDRRRGTHDYGRVVWSRGPLIRGLVVASGLSSLAAIVALIIALTVFGHRLDVVGFRLDVLQRARQRAAFDTCRLFRLVLAESPARAPVYSHGRLLGFVRFDGGRGASFLAGFERKIGLSDCNRYARRVRAGVPVVPASVKVPRVPAAPARRAGGVS